MEKKCKIVLKKVELISLDFDYDQHARQHFFVKFLQTRFCNILLYRKGVSSGFMQNITYKHKNNNTCSINIQNLIRLSLTMVIELFIVKC